MSEGIGVLTTTFYRSPGELRYQMAQRTITKAIAAGHPVIVVDGSPDDGISQSFRKVGAMVFKQQARGMGPSRRELFTHAGKPEIYDAGLPDVFVWLEPEREDLVRWLPMIAKPIQDGEADIVIPERTETSWASYPAFQIESEQTVNQVYAAVTGRRDDMTFGPLAFPFALSSLFGDCNPERYGGYDTYIQQIAAMEAMARGCRVWSVPVDFIYPPEQKQEEEITKRDDMLYYRWWNAMQFTKTICLTARALGLVKG